MKLIRQYIRLKGMANEKAEQGNEIGDKGCG